MKLSKVLAAGLVLVAAAGLGACGDDDDDGAPESAPDQETGTTATTAAAPTGPSVSFSEPADGATVATPVTLKMVATDFTIEPAGDGTVTGGHGHFHVMVDAECIATGTVIPKDATHNHYGMGQTEATLELAPGAHTLCLQVGDGAHAALGLTDQVAITVQ